MHVVEEIASMGPLIFISGNGAAGAGVEAGIDASMGPLIFISGNNLGFGWAYLFGTGFNGAADFHQRKFAILEEVGK